MSRFLKFCVVFWVAIFLGNSFSGTGWADLKDDGLRPVEESQSFQDYLKKPKTDLSKLIFAIDYYRNEPVMVRFDDVDYPVQFAYPIGLVYLLTYYKNEKPEAWIKKNCYRSPTANKIMYFKYPDGSYREVRETALELIRKLEKAEKNFPKQESGEEMKK